MQARVNLVLLVGGGTGGHVFPLAAVVRHYRGAARCPAFAWAGEAGGLEEKVARDLAVPFYPVTSGKVRRHFSLRTLATPLRVLAGFFQSYRLLRSLRPTLVFSKGGYVAVPVALAARCAGVPVALHESDAVPGWANRVVGLFAKRVLLNFPEAARYFRSDKVTAPGPLLSPELFEGASAPADPKPKPALLVLCGSQGSSRIFEALLSMPDLLCAFETHVVLGTANGKFGPRFRALPGVSAYDFLPPREIGRLAARADCAVTRASSAVFELEAFGVHMAMVPLPESANGHQLANARAFEKKGHAVILETRLAEGLREELEAMSRHRKEPADWKLPEGPFREIEKLLAA